MRNRNNNNNDFSNREGFHEVSDQSQRDSFRSQYDDGMSRSERNDYRPAGSTYGSRGLNSGRSSYSSSDYDYNRSGYRGDSSGFSGQNRADYDRQQYRSHEYERAPRSMTGRFDQDYSTRRALEDREIGINANSPSNYDDYRDVGSGFSTNEGRYAAPYGSDSSYLSSRSSQTWPRSSEQTPNQWGSQSFQGQHSGKGPKGYRRSDERIKEEISEALRRHPEIDASEIEVEVAEGVVTLSGTVESRQTKRMTEDLVEGLSGVNDLKNELRVMATESSRSRAYSSFDSTKTESMDYGKASAATTGKNAQTSKTSQPTTGKSVQ